MEWFAGSRFAITPKPAPYRDVAFDVAMLGHSPGRARVERLLTLSRTLDEMRNAGYTNAVEALLTGKGLDGKSITTQQRQLYHLPIPLYSSAEFHDIFPDADLLECEYSSVLAGDNAWLSQSVDDFFKNGGEKLWLVRIPESEGQDGFLCPTELALHDVDSLRGIATVFAIPSVALISMPDLERLQIPSQLPDMPKPILTSTSP